ncbi:MAG: hypothetical protein JST16_02405 [Bdellovibrionales bacterium]|nr:hypothetical protein [Bdellovibrionales bacterium]
MSFLRMSGIALTLISSLAHAQAVVDPLHIENVEKEGPLRSLESHYIGVSFGTPSPSWFGVTVGYQPSSYWQLMLSAGYFKADDIRVGSLDGSVRFYLFDTNFSPLLGVGITSYFVSGSGQFQGLEPTTLYLGHGSAGLAWDFHHQWRIAAGVNLHVPVKLVFPFVDLGVRF